MARRPPSAPLGADRATAMIAPHDGIVALAQIDACARGGRSSVAARVAALALLGGLGALGACGDPASAPAPEPVEDVGGAEPEIGRAHV